MKNYLWLYYLPILGVLFLSGKRIKKHKCCYTFHFVFSSTGACLQVCFSCRICEAPVALLDNRSWISYNSTLLTPNTITKLIYRTSSRLKEHGCMVLYSQCEYLIFFFSDSFLIFIVMVLIQPHPTEIILSLLDSLTS